MPQDDLGTPRSRRARNSLTIEEILDAAERVANSGYETLTVRAVAAELASSPMSLYRYFTTKDELVDALLNRVLGRFKQPNETTSWIADLREFAHHHRKLLLDHPWAIIPLTSHPNPGPNALPNGEVALRILNRGGITGDDAVATFSGVIALNYGWSSFMVGRQKMDALDDAHGAIPPSAMPADYPLTSAVARAIGRYGSDEHYNAVMNQLLTGIRIQGRE